MRLYVQVFALLFASQHAHSKLLVGEGLQAHSYWRLLVELSDVECIDGRELAHLAVQSYLNAVS